LNLVTGSVSNNLIGDILRKLTVRNNETLLRVEEAVKKIQRNKFLLLKSSRNYCISFFQTVHNDTVIDWSRVSRFAS